MDSLADSSVSKVQGKLKFKNRNYGRDRFPSNFKWPKFEAIRDFPLNCGPSSGVKVQSEKMHPKPNTGADSASPATLDGARSVAAIPAMPLRSMPSTSVQWATLDSAKSVAAIPAMPLRSMQSTNVQSDSENTPPAHGSDGVAQILARDNENEFGSKKFLEDEVGEVDILIAQARKYISLSNVNPSSCIDVKSMESETKGLVSASGLREGTSTSGTDPLVQTRRREGTVRDETVVAESVEGAGVPKVVRGERTCNLDKIPEGNEEAHILLSAELSTAQPSIKHKFEDSITSAEKFKTIGRGICKMEESRGSELVNCELVGTKCEEKHQDHSLVSLDASASLGPEAKFIGDCYKSFERSCDVLQLKCNEEHMELINISIVKHDDPQGHKVRSVLKHFEEQYTQLWMEYKSKKSGRAMEPLNMIAARYLKECGLCLTSEKPFGHIPGVEIGDLFRFRAELFVIGLHRQFISGIDYLVVNDKICATSIIESGLYENQAKSLDVLIYTGQGGNPKIGPRVEDQKLERGNLALMNSKEMRYPVRVTYKRKGQIASNALGKRSGRNYVYIYDGLYTINSSRQERDQNGKLVFKFELHRMEGQPRGHQTNVVSRVIHTEVCMVDDISRGKEKFPIRAINGVDDDRMPQSFTYITNMMYGSWCEHVKLLGCDCMNSCSDSHLCSCVLKNGGEIPFNKKGEILGERPIVHECGPSCKCPPSCMNRVSQHGLKCKLEIFKTMNRGWGVRSRNYISSGSFVCEYVGELLRDNKAEQRIERDEYLFDISIGYDGVTQKGVNCSLESKLNADGFAIDAAKFGNIGRFIKHSCSPNLYAQEVLYDHGDKRMPHIMFFSIKDIAPLRELTYDYNYKIKMDHVSDASGNIKTKDCYCGSCECIGRMH